MLRLTVLVVLFTACVGSPDLGTRGSRDAATAADDDPYALTSRPSSRSGDDGKTGMLPLVPRSPEDGWLVVPESYRSNRPARLILCLRGAGGEARAALRFFRDDVERRNLILVAPEARDRTWDPAVGGSGADAEFIDEALGRVFSRYAVDPQRVAIAGFSDGASFALTLGLSNGDLFRYVIAFSPGFMDVRTARGTPRIYVSHGTSDDTLPIDRTSEPIVAQLRRAGYDVTFRRFEGEHGVPDPVTSHVLSWFLDPRRR